MSPWRNDVRQHAIHYANDNNLPVTEQHDWVLSEGADALGFWPIIAEEAVNLDIPWHSRGNLTSSQIFAVNIVMGLENCESMNLLIPEKQVISLTPEWKDGLENVVAEQTKTSVDYQIVTEQSIWLLEVKYGEDRHQPCGSTHQNEVCQGDFPMWLNDCPLINEYGTRYMEVLRDPNGPINPQILSNLADGCPMRTREVYQLIRLISIAWLKNQQHGGSRWQVGVVFPEGNEFIMNEIAELTNCLNDPTIFHSFPVDEIVRRAMREENTSDWANYMAERYLLNL
ncbi:MAG: hypothetical protein HN936_16580 [Bacteroidetes bacterium]|mgnify:FL=1|jgi:hypothetical protein|nr:hypothetical protein [Bacteroidota bacterium]